MNFTLDCECEDDRRWLAEVAQLPGALACGSSASEALGSTVTPSALPANYPLLDFFT